MVKLEGVELVYRNVPEEKVEEVREFLATMDLTLRRRGGEHGKNPLVYCSYGPGGVHLSVGSGRVTLIFGNNFSENYFPIFMGFEKDSSRINFRGRDEKAINGICLDTGDWSEGK